MSKAKQSFLDGIRDAEKLFDYYHEESRSGPPPREAEVLKRAGLIMAMTAWETYVEDRVSEAVDARITATGANEFTGFFKARLDEELRRFNNPNSEKTCRLFKEYTGVDVSQKWVWNGYDIARTKARLDRKIPAR
jgi:hypothetical protein